LFVSYDHMKSHVFQEIIPKAVQAGIHLIWAKVTMRQMVKYYTENQYSVSMNSAGYACLRRLF